MSTSLREQVVTGVLWNTAARVGQQVMQFALSVVLARLLLPDDFGAIGMIMVFTGFISMLADVGFSSALVQRTQLTEQHMQSVFWFSVATGTLLSGAMFMGAPFVASFYGEPILVPLTRGLAPMFILSAVWMVPSALMHRRMQFQLVARIGLAATAVSGGVGVTLAVLGGGVWSLVAQTLSNYLIIAALGWLLSRWRPRFLFSWTALGELWRYTINLLGFSFVNYWARNADNLLVGRSFGSASLGYYSRAYGLMLLPINQILSVISNVMFPALSSIKEEQARVRSIYLRAMGLVSMLTFPIMVGLFVVAEPFVLAVYGDRWSDMIPLLQILTPVGAIQSVTNPTGWLYMSQGRTDWLFRWGVVRSSVLVMAIVAGILLGSVEMVAICYAFAIVLLLYPDIVIPGRLVQMRFGQVLRAVLGPLASSVGMGLVVYGLSLLLPGHLLAWQRLAILVAVGMAIYCGLVIGLRLSPWLELVGMVRQRMGKQSTSDYVHTSLP